MVGTSKGLHEGVEHGRSSRARDSTPGGPGSTIPRVAPSSLPGGCCLRLPGKPVADKDGLLSIYSGLLYGIVAYSFGQLGFTGTWALGLFNQLIRKGDPLHAFPIGAPSFVSWVRALRPLNYGPERGECFGPQQPEDKPKGPNFKAPIRAPGPLQPSRLVFRQMLRKRKAKSSWAEASAAHTGSFPRAFRYGTGSNVLAPVL